MPEKKYLKILYPNKEGRGEGRQGQYRALRYNSSSFLRNIPRQLFASPFAKEEPPPTILPFTF